MGSTWTDAGAYAIDRSPTTITSHGSTAVKSALQATEVSTLGNVFPDGTYGPWIVWYKATDEQGNESATLLRRIHIDASCPDGQEWCPELVACEAPVLCMPKLLGQAEFVAEVDLYVPPVDTKAPSLQLRLLPGDTVVSPVLPGPHILQTSLAVGQGGYTDPGWEAFDNFDWDMSARVSALGVSALQTAVASRAPTEPSSPFAIQYNVVDAAGNAATAVRLVHLLCGSGEVPCSKPDGATACTVDGVCDIMPTPQATAEPAVVQLVGPDVVLVAQGNAYRKCSSNLPLDLLCDQVRSIPSRELFFAALPGMPLCWLRCCDCC